MTTLEKQKTRRVRRRKGDENPFFDNPPLPGKKYFIASLVSPDNERQKCSVHSFKLHDMCGDGVDEEADRKLIEKLCERYRNMDPDFDVFVGTTGKWMAWVTDPLKAEDVQYVEQQQTELMRQKRKENEKVDKGFGKEVKDAMEGNMEDVQNKRRLAGKSEPAVVVWYKMRQIEEVIKARRNELADLQDIFYKRYTKEERKEAQKADLPLSKPAPMHFNSMAGVDDDSSSSDDEEGDGSDDEGSDDEDSK